LLFAEHDGYTDEALNSPHQRSVERINKTLQQVIANYHAKGFQGIYILTKSKIAQDIECSVDGTHPNDLGMMRYADSYEK